MKPPTSRTLPGAAVPSSVPGYCFGSVVFISVHPERCGVSGAWWELSLCVCTSAHGHSRPLFSAGSARASQRTSTCRRGMEGSVL